MSVLKKYEKTISLGKVDYLGNGRKDCPVTVSLSLVYEDDKPWFSASGTIWNHLKTDAYVGGQCLDEIAKYIHDETFDEILRLWESYHLNSMRPECEHQRALGWDREAHELISSFAFSLDDDASAKAKRAKERAIECLKSGSTFVPTEEETTLSRLPSTVVLPTDEAPEHYKADVFLFSPKTHERKESRGHVWFSKDSRGILGKPCPVCGYRYGTSWKYMPIPDEDILKIREIMGLDERE